MGIGIFILLSWKLSLFWGLRDYSDKFPKMFCSSCGMECPSTPNFCHQCGQPLNLSQVSNKAASSVDKEKPSKKYFIDFLRKRNYFKLLSGYFTIIFSRMCLRDQIFRVLLEHFISELDLNSAKKKVSLK